MEILLHSSKDISTVVKERRKALGYTQAEVASFCNVGLRFLSELENGKETLQLGKVLKVVNILGIDLIAKQRGVQ
ncbi:MAG: helix-turn-helix transcriptional regulator [Treponema sp.]|nr:helix-turn-helix transcriptional regulator [Treponema sp.]MBD5403683.1 helix-turn-helix transcriptional regulator [Treponema sp.]MBD5407446.1 helix-turn-helix transcriptional regulator [Treponema sp.]MBD5412229.1 helix-turn-helix transcriptional regulator [Treponema sp.]MBD5441870.1 helix-turn-helix transcriptional regulator [Treponema sp.]